MSAEQEARLVERADARGITVARLLAESALAGGADAAAATSQLGGELFRISRLLGRVSLNINQLAKVANATGAVPPETGHAVDAISRVCDRITELLDGRRL